MKILACVAVVAALSGTATAQEIPSPGQVRISPPPERIVLPPLRHNIWQEEFDGIKGSYALSNGKSMQLSMWGNRMYASMGSIGRVQLVAVSPYVFVTRDEQMRIAIEDPTTSSSNRINATLTLPAHMLSSTAAPGEFVTLLAQR